MVVREDAASTGHRTTANIAIKSIGTSIRRRQYTGIPYFLWKHFANRHTHRRPTGIRPTRGIIVINTVRANKTSDQRCTQRWLHYAILFETVTCRLWSCVVHFSKASNRDMPAPSRSWFTTNTPCRWSILPLMVLKWSYFKGGSKSENKTLLKRS